MSLIDNIGTGAGVGTSIAPGVGTIVGAGVGALSDFLDTLLGGTSQHDVANNQFIDNLVSGAQKLGFSGFTHNDVVHLMIGGWGSNYPGATQGFQNYLNSANNHPAGTNLVPYFSFGGGYQPGHEITYNPPVSNVLSNTGNTVGNLNGTQNNSLPSISAGSSNTMMYVLFGVIALGVIYGLMKAK